MEVRRGWFALADVERDINEQIRREKRRLGLLGTCEICQRETRVYQDHDHGNGLCRGKLCYQCNTSIGLLRKDVAVLTAAIDYVRRWQTRHYHSGGLKYRTWAQRRRR